VREINFNQLLLCYFLTKSYAGILLESSRRDDPNKWSNIGFGQEIDIIELKTHTLSGALYY